MDCDAEGRVGVLKEERAGGEETKEEEKNQKGRRREGFRLALKLLVAELSSTSSR